MWSDAGQLDWWVKERQEGGVGYAVRTVCSRGSGLLILVLRRASDRYRWLRVHKASRWRLPYAPSAKKSTLGESKSETPCPGR